MANQRNSSIELLRLVLMFMIVMHHCIVHGLGLKGLSWDGVAILISETQIPYMMILNCFFICAVNCFIIISGYFGIKVTSRKIASLLFTVLFYTVLLTSIPALFEGNIAGAFTSLLIVSHSQNWFIVAYLFLMAFAPMINAMFEHLEEKSIRYVLIAFILICCYFGFVWQVKPATNGYCLMQFIMLYTIGRYIRLRDWSLSKKWALSCYAVCSLLCGIGMCILYYCHILNPWGLSAYSNPLIVAAAVCLFMAFKNFAINSHIINSVATSALSIYLVQESPLGRKMFYPMIAEICGRHPENGGG